MARGGGYTLSASPVSKFHDYTQYLNAIKIPWVNAVCTKRAHAFAKNGWDLIDEKEKMLDNPDDPLLQLMERPNSLQSGFQFRELGQMYLFLTGNCYISLEQRDGDGKPRELYLPNPSRMMVALKGSGEVKGYVYDPSGQTGAGFLRIPYDVDEIIHRKLPNPTDDHYGLGLIEAGEQLLETVVAMGDHELGYWRSGGRIIGVLQSDEVLSEEEFDQLKEEWANANRDQQQRSRTAVLQKGVRYTPVAEGLRALDITSIDKSKRDTILAMWGVPATKLGILENAQYKLDDADHVFHAETLEADYDRWEDDIQPLIDLFDDSLCWRMERKDFENDTEKLGNARSMFESGLFTADESRIYFGADPLPNGNGNVLAISSAFTMVPLDDLGDFAKQESQTVASGGGQSGGGSGGDGVAPPDQGIASQNGSPPKLPTLAAHMKMANCECIDCYDGASWFETKGDLPGHEFHGNQWTVSVGGHTETYDQIIDRLSHDQKVALASTKQVATLIDRMAKLANDPRTKTINLCNVSVPGTNVFCAGNVGKSRIEMPQFSGKPLSGTPADSMAKDERGNVDLAQAFIDHMREQGISVERDTEQASHLKASQKELQGVKVAGMAQAMREGKMPPGSIFISQDNYVVDGHHRWAADVANDARSGTLGDDKPMNVVRVGTDILHVLAAANDFTAKMGIPNASMTGEIAKKDYVGHPFRGNQYRDAMGGNGRGDHERSIGNRVRDTLKGHPVNVKEGFMHVHAQITPTRPNPAGRGPHPDLVNAQSALDRAGYRTSLRKDNKLIAMPPLANYSLTGGMGDAFGFPGVKQFLTESERIQLLRDMMLRQQRRTRVASSMARKNVRTPKPIERLRMRQQQLPVAKAHRRASLHHPVIAEAIQRTQQKLFDNEMEPTIKRLREAFRTQRGAITKPSTLGKIVKTVNGKQTIVVDDLRKTLREQLPAVLYDALRPTYEAAASEGRRIAISVLPPKQRG